jgi:hypothetical protein
MDICLIDFSPLTTDFRLNIGLIPWIRKHLAADYTRSHIEECINRIAIQQHIPVSAVRRLFEMVDKEKKSLNTFFLNIFKIRKGRGSNKNKIGSY